MSPCVSVHTSQRVSVESANVLYYHNNRKNDNFTRKKVADEVMVSLYKWKERINLQVRYLTFQRQF